VVWIPDSKTPNGVAEVPLTDIAPSRHFEGSLRSRGQALFCSRATRRQTSLRSRSRQFGGSRCGGQVFSTFGSTICYRRTLRGSAPAEWRTSGSRSCFDRGMQRCSRSTRR
jgi:hypothetical protein